MKKTVLSVAVASLVAASLSTPAFSAEISTNIGVTSNYLWRGWTQTDDASAVQGGIDADFGNGFYLGTWASNVSWTDPDGYELDIYGGYAGETTSGLGYDVGYIGYFYPVGDGKNDFHEIYGSLSYGVISGGLAYTFEKEDSTADTGDIYAYLGIETELAQGFGFGATLGYTDWAADGDESVSHIDLTFTKEDFGFTLSKTDEDDSDVKVAVSYGLTF